MSLHLLFDFKFSINFEEEMFNYTISQHRENE